MDIEDIGTKVNNGGINDSGKLYAEEFNAVVDAVRKRINVYDGGDSRSVYGGARKIDCGTSYTEE